MEELMLKIDNVSKEYVLGQIGGTTLRDELQRLSARLHGREDPTKRIGAKDYNKGEKFLALDGVSFEVRKGERVGIIGHNGAGKSTLLKLISRVTAPTRGSIGLNGRVASMLEVGTGFHPELTGRENIYMNGAILGMTKKEIDAKMEDIIEFSECRQFIDTPVKRYSSGMYVKLAFSVAAHLDSEIMIMDEVLAVGDMAFQKKCLDKMSDVSKTQGRTILYVSHNMNTIRQLCDRVIVLDHGHVVFDGGVEEGIGVYMGSGVNVELKTQYLFGKAEHRGFVPKEAQIEQFVFLNKSSSVFERGENVDCELVFRAIQNFELVSFRMQIYLDGIELIGSFFLNDVFPINAGSRYRIRFTMDTRNMVPGQYRADLVLFCRDRVGNAKAADVIMKGISFEMVDSGNTGELYWWRKPFGYVKYENLVLKKMHIL